MTEQRNEGTEPGEPIPGASQPSPWEPAAAAVTVPRLPAPPVVRARAEAVPDDATHVQPRVDAAPPATHGAPAPAEAAAPAPADEVRLDGPRAWPTGLISDELAPAITPPADAEAEPTRVESLYRDDAASGPQTPAEVDEETRQLSEEERRLNAERAARREARQAALAAADAPPPPPPAPVVVTRRTTDTFVGGLGLFLLRLVVAGIMAVRGLDILTDLPAAQAEFAKTVIPEPAIMALVTGVASLAIAVALVFGLLVRVAGLGVLLIAGGALTFVLWGAWSPFVDGRPGFLGELELLLAAVGVLFLTLGGGGLGLDRGFRKSREKDRLGAQQG